MFEKPFKFSKQGRLDFLFFFHVIFGFTERLEHDCYLTGTSPARVSVELMDGTES